MKNRAISLALTFAFLLLPLAPMMANAQQEGMQEGMAMGDGMIMLGEETVYDVKAMVHLQDVRATMTKMGRNETHHLMVMFADAQTGEPINAGTVAVKVKGPSGEETAPLRMIGMQGHFGTDLALQEKGKYNFTIGTKLNDDKKRQFHFTYEQ